MTNDKHPMKRGINLGGWLVRERWMTPSLFAGAKAKDEFTLLRDFTERQDDITRHQDEFVTETDMEWMKAYEITEIRVPVGWWLFEDDDIGRSALKALDWLFEAAKKYDMHILLSIHAAPGSQNGKDHSGKIGVVEWWNHRNKLEDFTIALLERYGSYRNLYGLGVLNEPSSSTSQIPKLLLHYRKIVKHARKRYETKLFVDATFHPRLWIGVAKMLDVGVDFHWYNGAQNDYEGAMKELDRKKQLIQSAKILPYFVIGEWSAMLAKKSTHEERTKYYEAQIEEYKQANANFYWSYKTEGGGVWSYRDWMDQVYT